MSELQRCEGCQTDTCFTPWPDDDPHKPGQMRGCFKEASGTLNVETVRGRDRKGRMQKHDPSWEKGRAGEQRAGGTFMPYLDPKTGAPMTVKRYAEAGRHLVKEQKQRLAARSNQT